MHKKLLRLDRYAIGSWIVLLLMAGNNTAAFANRAPVITSNLGGTKISCSIYEDQATVAGVRPGFSETQVRKILGAPGSVHYLNSTLDFFYPSRTIRLVDFGGDGSYVLVDINTTNKNDATLDGVRVGMPETVLNEIYGEADAVWKTTYESPKLTSEVNQKNHARFDENVYQYNANETIKMSFKVQKGIIKEIHIHQSE